MVDKGREFPARYIKYLTLNEGAPEIKSIVSVEKLSPTVHTVISTVETAPCPYR